MIMIILKVLVTIMMMVNLGDSSTCRVSRRSPTVGGKRTLVVEVFSLSFKRKEWE